MPKRRKGGKNKGSGFEREMSKELSMWWTYGERDDLIWLTSQSGGRATTRFDKGLGTAFQYGDLCPTDPDIIPFFEFFLIECKRGYTKEVDVLLFLDKLDHVKNQGVVLNWWEKAERDRERSNSYTSLLIIKRDNHKPVCIFDDRLCYFITNTYGWGGYPWMRMVNSNYDLNIMLLTDLFTILEPEDIRNFKHA